MIVFDLLCGDGHRFEGWFGSSEDFSSQKQHGLLSCPICGGLEVERVPSATRFNAGAEEPKTATEPEPASKGPTATAESIYSRIMDQILEKTEDVGTEFPAEARRIFYAEVPARPIRGQATQEEHDALVEEGVPVARLPLPPPRQWN